MKLRTAPWAMITVTVVFLSACAGVPSPSGAGHAGSESQHAAMQKMHQQKMDQQMMHQQMKDCAMMKQMHQSRGADSMKSCPMHADSDEHKSSDGAQPAAPEEHKH